MDQQLDLTSQLKQHRPTIFSGIAARGMEVRGGIDFAGAVVLGNVDFGNAHIESDIRFVWLPSKTTDVVAFRTIIMGRLSMNRVRVVGRCAFRGMWVDGDVRMAGAEIHGDLDCEGWHPDEDHLLPSNAERSIRGGPSIRTRIGGRLVVRSARITGAVNLDGISVGENVTFSNSDMGRFSLSVYYLRRDNAAARYDRLKEKAVVKRSPLGAEVHGALLLHNATIRSDCSLGGARIKGGLMAPNLTTHGGLDLRVWQEEGCAPFRTVIHSGFLKDSLPYQASLFLTDCRIGTFISLAGARLPGGMHLTGSMIGSNLFGEVWRDKGKAHTFRLCLGRCHLPEDDSGHARSVFARGVTMGGSWLLKGARLSGDLDFRNSTCNDFEMMVWDPDTECKPRQTFLRGGLLLMGAHIRGSLDLTGAHLSMGCRADTVRIDGHFRARVYLPKPAEADAGKKREGVRTAIRSHFGHQKMATVSSDRKLSYSLWCEGAQIGGYVSLRGSEFVGGIGFDHSTIGGGLYLEAWENEVDAYPEVTMLIRSTVGPSRHEEGHSYSVSLFATDIRANVELCGAQLEGGLDMSNSHVGGDVRLDAFLRGKGYCTEIGLSEGSRTPYSLYIGSLTVKGDFLASRVQVGKDRVGGVFADGVQIDGRLDLSRATLGKETRSEAELEPFHADANGRFRVPVDSRNAYALSLRNATVSHGLELEGAETSLEEALDLAGSKVAGVRARLVTIRTGGIRANETTIGGSLDFSESNIGGTLEFDGIRIEGKADLSKAHLTNAARSRPSLAASGCTITGELVLDGLKASGGINLHIASISDNLSMNSSHVRRCQEGDREYSLRLSSAVIGGNLTLQDAVLTSSFAATNLRLSGLLWAKRARFGMGSWPTGEDYSLWFEGAKIHGAVRLDYAVLRIARSLVPDRIKGGVVNFRNVEVGGDFYLPSRFRMRHPAPKADLLKASGLTVGNTLGLPWDIACQGADLGDVSANELRVKMDESQGPAASSPRVRNGRAILGASLSGGVPYGNPSSVALLSGTLALAAIVALFLEHPWVYITLVAVLLVGGGCCSFLLGARELADRQEPLDLGGCHLPSIDLPTTMPNRGATSAIWNLPFGLGLAMAILALAQWSLWATLPLVIALMMIGSGIDACLWPRRMERQPILALLSHARYRMSFFAAVESLQRERGEDRCGDHVHLYRRRRQQREFLSGGFGRIVEVGFREFIYEFVGHGVNRNVMAVLLFVLLAISWNLAGSQQYRKPTSKIAQPLTGAEQAHLALSAVIPFVEAPATQKWNRADTEVEVPFPSVTFRSNNHRALRVEWLSVPLDSLLGIFKILGTITVPFLLASAAHLIRRND
ncbi:MAG: hypothetical protein M9921_14525 [Fimbriimonadaceae bacterium]|nr:hypothetical protein [Chthonomonadaceae bacterium]MCO5298060.1 hypothetical protein [Fimbriimonadaceae bacterium]